MKDLQACATRIRDAATFLKNLDALQPRLENMDGIESGVGEGVITVSIRTPMSIFGGPWAGGGMKVPASATQDCNILSQRLLEAARKALEPYKARAELIITLEAAALLDSLPKIPGETQGKLQENSSPGLPAPSNAS
jgi:hypothetical protein